MWRQGESNLKLVVILFSVKLFLFIRYDERVKRLQNQMKCFLTSSITKGMKKKMVKVSSFLYLVFPCVAQNVERWLNILISYMVYSQIWLNLPKDDCHFFYIFLQMTASLVTNKNSFKNKNTPREGGTHIHETTSQ